MASIAFDTLQAARDLESAGVKRAEAEAIALTIHKAQGESATKGDIASVKGDIASVKGDIASVKGDIALLRWVVGIQSAITLATFAAVLWLAARLL